MFARSTFSLTTDRMVLRPPQQRDFKAWAALRMGSQGFLIPWDPAWTADHLTRKNFTNRVYWARRSITAKTAYPLFLTRKNDGALMGAITLDHIRRGPVQSGTIGYWIGQDDARQGLMKEAVLAVVNHSFITLDLSRIEAACLPENKASRGLLEASGFKYEGVAQSYLQIAGRWRTHVLYACLRYDRRGKTDAGVV